MSKDDASHAGTDRVDAMTSAAARAREQAAVHEARTFVEFDDHDEASPFGAHDLDPRDDDEPSQLAIGRYPLLRRLGSGGMGVVYAAYDEVLDRRVAIKVLHGRVWDVDGRRRERLLREAQAMARVTHPNVITVHEVGTADDQLFVAMEFVAGPTLKEWLAAEPRGWRAIVRVFRQIADGLAALHDAGLVHRDVKPTNVLIGDDGRVRVLDLGLVSTDPHELHKTEESDKTEANASSSTKRSDLSLTKTGERLGTPAYMPREQFLGLEQTPASDIFSLSISLYEAVHGVHPFIAKTFQELQANVIEGRITPPPKSSTAPAWLHALILRGLAPDPKDRPASMRALSAALDKDPSRARGPMIGTVAVAVLAAIGGVAISRAQAPLPIPTPTCDGAIDAIAAVWDDDRAAQVRAAMLSTRRPYADALAGPIIAGLDEYAATWAEAHQRTCRDHARGEHSGALLDARMACLDRRRTALAETLAILIDADADVIDHAGQMVAKLPRIEPCDDLAALAARRPPPADAQTARALADFDAQLVRVDAMINAGRVDEATALARAIATRAEALEQPATVAAALLGEARASIVMQVDRSSTAALLERALTIAIPEQLDRLAAEAMILRLYIRGLASGGSEAALADLPIARAMLARAGNDPELDALLLNNGGAIRLAAGDREGARTAFERSLASKERLLGADHLELALSLANLGMLTSDPNTRAKLHQRMIAIYERRVGPDHPRTLDARLLAALYTADPLDAGRALRDLCPRFIEIDEPRLAGECELEHGRIELARGRLPIAQRAFRRARDHFGDDDARRTLLDAYLSLTQPSDPRAAIIELEAKIVATDANSSSAWWVRLEQAERRLLLARLLAERGDPSASVALLERAITELESIVEQAPPIERERLLAGSLAALALALEATGESDASTLETLASDASKFYARWPDAYALPLQQLRPRP